MEMLPAISTGLAVTAFAVAAGIGSLVWLVLRRRRRAVFDLANISKSGLLAAGDCSSTQKLLVKTLQINAELQKRLADVESRLHEHSENITDFMTEARTDGLTGLPNRRALDDELTRRIIAWRKNQRPLIVALLDIDYFKKFNDRYGHLAGDAVLSSVARALAQSVRDGDLVGRLGGEEFAVIFSVREVDDAALAVERMRKVVESTEVAFEGTLLRVTTSCGLAAVGQEMGGAELLKHADLALYAAKGDGRNCAHFHDGFRSRRITPGESGPPSPSVNESYSAPLISSPVAMAVKGAPSSLMVELSRDLRRRLDEVTQF